MENTHLQGLDDHLHQSTAVLYAAGKGTERWSSFVQRGEELSVRAGACGTAQVLSCILPRVFLLASSGCCCACGQSFHRWSPAAVAWWWKKWERWGHVSGSARLQLAPSIPAILSGTGPASCKTTSWWFSVSDIQPVFYILKHLEWTLHPQHYLLLLQSLRRLWDKPLLRGVPADHRGSWFLSFHLCICTSTTKGTVLFRHLNQQKHAFANNYFKSSCGIESPVASLAVAWCCT